MKYHLNRKGFGTLVKTAGLVIVLLFITQSAMTNAETESVTAEPIITNTAPTSHTTQQDIEKPLDKKVKPPEAFRDLRLILGYVKSFVEAKSLIFVYIVAITAILIVLFSWQRVRYMTRKLEKITGVLDDTIDKSGSISARRATPEPALPSLIKAAPAFYISDIKITNIRCFSNIHVSFESKNSPHLRTILLGDNSLGKSTLLRSIALSLCNESDATALMKSMPGKIIKQGEKEGFIEVQLRNDNGSEYCWIKKHFTRMPDGSEIVRQDMIKDFPWKSVFICGYGTQRTAVADASFDSYSIRKAVATLFDDQSKLQNPELVLLRRESNLRQLLQDKLIDIMLLDDEDSSIEDTKLGLVMRGPWGSIPLDSLSDGYRSTTQWILDLFAWMIHADRLPAKDEPAGILLIDEIEQHLHPRWQRHILQRLSRQFPRMQIIATTHTPLIASGTADVDSSAIFRLKKRHQEIAVETIDPDVLQGKRADQILTEVFDLLASRNPGSSDNISRYVQLRAMARRNAEEEKELEKLSQQVESTLSFGETEFERNVEKAVSKTLDTMLHNPPTEKLDLEVKRQLRELFRDERGS